MAKDILAFFGLIFLTLLIILGVALVGVFYDQVGMISLPAEVRQMVDSLVTPAAVEITDTGIGFTEWSNPLDALPTQTASPEPTATPVPTLTPSPIPPLDPAVYRTETIARLKNFASALQRWFDANQKLAEDNTLIDDPAWRTEVTLLLENVRSTGKDLASVGPAPQEYAGIDIWLKKAGPEAATLQADYLRAMDSRDPKDFLAAGSTLTRIKEDLSQAVEAMLAAGWTME